MTATLPACLALISAFAPAAPSGQPAASKAGGPSVELGERAVPLFSAEAATVAVAQVGEDAITVRDFAQLLADAHASHESASGAQRDFRPALERLIDARLITLEARAMGMDELPEFKSALAEFKVNALREMVRSRIALGVKTDRAAVERAFREKVREWKVQSALFDAEAEATTFAANATAATFGETAARLAQEGKARSRVEGQVLTRGNAQPAVLASLEKLRAGEVSVPLKLPDGWAVLLVEEIRHPEDAAARAEAERAVMGPLRSKALQDRFQALTRKHAKIDEKLLKALDYDAKGPERFAKDRRPIARIDGEAPITVADLTAELKRQFFHGVEQAAKDRKVNRKKQQFFEGLLVRKLLDREARVLRLAESDDFRRTVAEYERSQLFGAFVSRAILPEIKVTEADARAYYDGHATDFRTPELYRLETLAFARAADAQAACKKLQGGTDVKWLRANAEHQLDPAKRTIQLDGTNVTATSLPEGLAAILSGAKAGDCRIYARSDAECYAVLVGGKTERQVQPFADARPAIDAKLFPEKVNASIAEWAKKLRKGYEIKVFITGLRV